LPIFGSSGLTRRSTSADSSMTAALTCPSAIGRSRSGPT
jgi:hypothetical protein